MKIAYLLVFHKDPLLLQRAVDVLSTDDCAFFIHIDRKTDIAAYRGIANQRTFLCEPRVPVYWAEFSSIRATRLLLGQALASRVQFDYFVLLQGSTYPLRSGDYIQRFFERHRGAEFMNLVRMPAPGYPLSKMNLVVYPSDQPVRRLAARLLAKVGFARRNYRRHLPGLEAYSGHACWALSRRACEYVQTFDARNPHVARYFANAFVPDESFFHTLIGNSPFRSHVRRNLVYADWSNSEGHHPANLGDDHVSFFESEDKVWIDDEWGAGEMLFARKFSDADIHLLDRIDTMIRRKEGPGSWAVSRS